MRENQSESRSERVCVTVFGPWSPTRSRAQRRRVSQTGRRRDAEAPSAPAPGSGEAAPLRSPRSGPRSSRPCPGQPGEPSPDADLQRPLRPWRFSERQRPSPPSDSRVLCAALLAVDVTSGLWESHSFGSFGFVTSHVNRCRPGGLVSKMIGSELSCLILSCINTQTYIIQNTVYEVTHANKTIISGKRSMAA